MKRKISSNKQITIITLVVIYLCPFSFSQDSLNANKNILVGAIRWDAWYGNQDVAGQSSYKTLSPNKWHVRLPFFAKEIDKDSIEMKGATQTVVDQEIKYASDAGLDYWAFVAYPPSDNLSQALKYYLSSTLKVKINFCLVTECDRWSGPEYISWLIHLIRQPGYQVVLGNRPLLYLGFISQDVISKYFGDARGFGKTLSDFRDSVKSSGLADPYIVIMNSDPAIGKKWLDSLNCQALSSYEINCGEEKASYSNLTKCTEAFWKRCRDANVQVVPIIMSGWDRRPRVETPAPWESWQKPGIGINKYYESPTATELYEHVKSALNWLEQNKAAAEARTALIYAWDEFEEGGYIEPTLLEGTARLDAVAKALNSR